MTESVFHKFRILNSSMLKTIALVTMFIDHFAMTILYWGILYPNMNSIFSDDRLYMIYQIYTIMRNIGRIAFPIFCFQLVEGFIHTSNRKKYALRLALFALISEIPFNLAAYNQLIDPLARNIFFTLLIGLFTIWAMEKLEQIHVFLMAVPAVIGCIIAYLINCDYDYRGIILIILLYFFRYHKGLQTLAGSISLYWEWPAIFAFIPINLYNGKKGWNMKYFTYLFYPAHLLLLYLIKLMIL